MHCLKNHNQVSLVCLLLYRYSASWYLTVLPPPVEPSEDRLRNHSGPKFIESVILFTLFSATHVSKIWKSRLYLKWSFICFATIYRQSRLLPNQSRGHNNKTTDKFYGVLSPRRLCHGQCGTWPYHNKTQQTNNGN